jgi:uncharacterized membrane protein YeiH
MSVELIWLIMEHLGVVAFAISGAIVAINREMDVFGVIFISFITSFGGGIMRDLILNRGIPAFFTRAYMSLIIVCFISSLLVFLLAFIFKHRFVKKEAFLDTINNYIDAFGIGAFTVSGAFVAAGHLAFTLAFDQRYIFPMIVGKLISGITAVVVAVFIYKRIYAKENA